MSRLELSCDQQMEGKMAAWNGPLTYLLVLAFVFHLPGARADISTETLCQHLQSEPSLCATDPDVCLSQVGQRLCPRTCGLCPSSLRSRNVHVPAEEVCRDHIPLDFCKCTDIYNTLLCPNHCHKCDVIARERVRKDAVCFLDEQEADICKDLLEASPQSGLFGNDPKRALCLLHHGRELCPKTCDQCFQDRPSGGECNTAKCDSDIFAVILCPKTCGVEEKINNASGVCRGVTEESVVCGTVTNHKLCNETFVSKLCPRTCGKCPSPSPSTSPASLTGARADISTETLCQHLQSEPSLCATDPDVCLSQVGHRLCPRTCGLCPSSLRSRNVHVPAEEKECIDRIPGEYCKCTSHYDALLCPNSCQICDDMANERVRKDAICFLGEEEADICKHLLEEAPQRALFGHDPKRALCLLHHGRELCPKTCAQCYLDRLSGGECNDRNCSDIFAVVLCPKTCHVEEKINNASGVCRGDTEESAVCGTVTNDKLCNETFVSKLCPRTCGKCPSPSPSASPATQPAVTATSTPSSSPTHVPTCSDGPFCKIVHNCSTLFGLLECPQTCSVCGNYSETVCQTRKEKDVCSSNTTFCHIDHARFLCPLSCGYCPSTVAPSSPSTPKTEITSTSSKTTPTTSTTTPTTSTTTPTTPTTMPTTPTTKPTTSTTTPTTSTTTPTAPTTTPTTLTTTPTTLTTTPTTSSTTPTTLTTTPTTSKTTPTTFTTTPTPTHTVTPVTPTETSATNTSTDKTQLTTPDGVVSTNPSTDATSDKMTYKETASTQAATGVTSSEVTSSGTDTAPTADTASSATSTDTGTASAATSSNTATPASSSSTAQTSSGLDSSPSSTGASPATGNTGPAATDTSSGATGAPPSPTGPSSAATETPSTSTISSATATNPAATASNTSSTSTSGASSPGVATASTSSTATKASTAPSTTATTAATTTSAPTTPSTTKGPKTTTTHVPVVKRSCYQCGDAANRSPCTPMELALGSPSQCPPGLAFCQTDIIQEFGGRVITKRCVDRDTCEREWYRQTSDVNECTFFDPTSLDFDLQCHFCCAQDDCNVGLKPDESVLFIPS